MLSLWIGGAGLAAGSRYAEVVGNNLANVNTLGFHRSRPSFRDELSNLLWRPALATAGTLPQVGTGVRLAATLRDTRTGFLIPTGNQLDLAIEGPGYLPVRRDGEILYVRGGSFRRDEMGRLVTDGGAVLLQRDGDEVRIPEADASWTLREDGVFTTGSEEGGDPVAELHLARFANPSGLASRGEGLWAATVWSGEPSLGRPGEGGRGSLRQGVLESSNVDLGEEFVDLILAQRSLQLNARVVTTSDEMLALANQLPA